MNAILELQDSLPQRLRDASVPVLHQGVPKLIHSLSDNDIGVAEVAAVVERFPSVTLRLIALANSVWSSPASPVTSLPMACSRLGLNVVRSVSIALAVASPFDPKRCPGFDVDRYWSSALLTADTAYALAETLPNHADLDAQSVRTAGLLHNIGLVWMASHMPMEVAGVLKLKAADPDASLSGLMREHIGLDYASAGAYIGATWRLPDPIVLSMQRHDGDYQGEAWPTVRLVRRACTMVSVLLDTDSGERQSGKLAMLRGGDAGSETAALLDEIRGRVESTRALVQELFAG